MIWDLYDGVRSGIALYRGQPHYFSCEFDEGIGNYADTFSIWPVPQNVLEISTENWEIYRAWERRFHAGEVPLATHPGHGGLSPRYDETEHQIDTFLAALGEPTGRLTAVFDARSEQPALPFGCLRDMDVAWGDVV